jgi:NADH-quinone oxidoreductase subunit N
MGFLFLGLSCANLTGFTSSFLYLFYYLITTFAFFSIILYIKNVTTGMDLIFIKQLTFLGKKNKNIALLLALFLFSMAGIPPLGGFFAKFFLFLAAFKCGNFGLLILALTTNVISVFYYLRLVKLMFFEKMDLNIDPLKIKDVYFFIEKKNNTILIFYIF